MQHKQKVEEQIELRVAQAAASTAQMANRATDDVALHGLLHSIKPARCSAKWEAMEGDDRVRKCKVCRAKAYRIDGLDGGEIAQLMAQHEGSAPTAKQRLYRRGDGSVMLHAGYCGTLVTVSALLVCALLTAVPVACKVDIATVPCLLVVASAVFLLNAFVRQERGLQKTRPILAAWILFIGMMVMAFGIHTSNVLLSSQGSLEWWLFSFVLSLGIGLIAFLVFCALTAADGIELLVRRMRGKRQADTATAVRQQTELSPLKFERRKPYRKIVLGILGMVTFFLAYCAYDANWGLQYFLSEHPSVVVANHFHNEITFRDCQ